MREQNSQFKKDVLKAKAKYRKRRKFIILAIMTFALTITLLQTFLYIRDKKQINAQLAEQNQMIENLDKENKVNELVIDKLRDPYFITDLVRQEYGLSYQGELIFNIPLQENFLQTTIKSIMEGKLEKSDDNNGRIDDSKIPELAKKDNKKSTSKKESDKTKDASTDKKASDKKTSDNTSEKDEDNKQDDNKTQRVTDNTNSNTNNQRSNRG
ncbi:septum formation initiator family protein [uncultured Gemella sp.]|uniref:FtsB family cell division protein n=1 Tax=uncultured Gemella sp. TaxID=254352 RepID=UPI0028D1E7E5|nr:septum formation initiator family protein [uncultured Gemella sp.]